MRKLRLLRIRKDSCPLWQFLLAVQSPVQWSPARVQHPAHAVLAQLTSIIRHKARIAFALYRISLPTPVSFMMLCVIIITSDAEFASSLNIRYII